MTPLCDPITTHVLKLPELRGRLQPQSPKAKALWKTPLPSSSFSQWHTEMLAILAIETWQKEQEGNIKQTQRLFGQLPLLSGALRSLSNELPLDDAQLFTIKRFLFYASFLIPSLWPKDQALLKDTLELMHAIHPEPKPTATFTLSPELSPNLATATHQLKTKQKALRTTQTELEERLLQDYPSGSWNIHGDLKLGDPVAQAKARQDPRLDPVQDVRLWRPNSSDLAKAKADVAKEQASVEVAQGALRESLSALTGQRIDWLASLEEKLGWFDLRLAKVVLKQREGGCWVRWNEDDRMVRFEELVPWDREEAQAISWEIDLGQMHVVTGPNMGGKSSLLKLVGQAVWSMQHHLPVRATSAAMPGTQKLLYLGAEVQDDSSSSGLSSFGQEIARLVALWQPHNKEGVPWLWLLDEFGRGTHPEEGARICQEVMGRLWEHGDGVLAATHFPQLAQNKAITSWRIRGLIKERQALERDIDQGVAIEDLERRLREAMDYQPEALLEEDDSVPRDARLVASLLGIDTLFDEQTDPQP